MKVLKEYIDGDLVKVQLANTPQITFEVTDACNLKCKYCGYGELYSDYDARNNQNLSDSKAFLFLDYIMKLFKSEECHSYNRTIFISFYGGEPLLNMRFIQEVVDYIEKIKDKLNIK